MHRFWKRTMTTAAIAALVSLVPPIEDVSQAAERASKSRKSGASATAKVRGSTRRVGGYSYTYADSIIDFRDRSIFIDPNIDNPGGPFDSGFFFDSGIQIYNDAPYPN